MAEDQFVPQSGGLEVKEGHEESDLSVRGIVTFLICRAVVTSKLGKVLIAVRDAESRTRFLGYRPESYKLVVWVLSAVMAGRIARAESVGYGRCLRLLMVGECRNCLRLKRCGWGFSR